MKRTDKRVTFAGQTAPITVLSLNGGGGSSSAQEAAVPTIRLDGPISGNVVVSDEFGNLFVINADLGTVSRVRWGN